MNDLREVRKLYDMYDVLDLDNTRDKIVCPLPDHVHANNTPSFRIFFGEDGIQRFHCHGNCGHHGDVIDLVGYLSVTDYDGNNPEHIQRAISLLDQEAPIRTEPVVAPKRKGLAPNKWRDYLPPGREVIEYAATRGLHINTVEKFRIGQYSHFMAMPVFEDRILKMIKFRNLWPTEQCDESDFDHLRFWTAKGSRKSLFNFDRVAYNPSPILVVKGEIPAMLLDQFGILACAPTGGESSYVEEWAEALTLSQKIVVVGDNDRDPETREKMQEFARKRADILHAELRFPPEDFKDIDEFILADIHALELIRSWIWG